MTENPAQGTAPENREPSEPRDSTGEQGDAGTTPQQPAWTSRQEAGTENPAQPTTPLPAFQPSAAPQQPQYYGAPQPHNQSYQQHDPSHRPSYPQHQPFYGGSNPGHNAASQFHNQQGFQEQQGHNSPGMQHTPGHSSVSTKRKPAFGVGTLVASMLAAGLIGGGVVAGSNALWDNPAPAASTGGQSSTVIVNNKDDVNVITAAAAKASPSVVTIKATSGNEGGTGSGIILDDQGHILTNTHVVTLDGATANAAIEVRTSDGKVLKATVVGTDPLSDLAVIKVSDASGLVPATLGDSSKINVGDTAVAIGSPLGLTGTVTDGIVSTLNRTISVASSAVPEGTPDESQGGDEGFQFAPPNGGQSQSTANEGSIAINVIQTDAAINPGNSGGALVNSKGEVIGVNVAIASAGSGTSESSSGNIGVGFSVPINHAKRVAQEIIETGKASHGQFGVSVRSKSSSGSDSGFSVGAEVASVTSGSAAAKAGLKVGDVVTKFGDYAVSDPNQLTAAVREQPAGAKVKVTIQRGGQTQEVEVTLDAAQQ
ncbi:trypsin-like peptidase domain-containing protein [Paenarthrobacter sp. TYUT067]|uniref:S1C family serine protease n=1 Tax=Paenarthrobacter sp. TYUT067 TaxID=2926245 RepID=UPI00202FDEF4|nr:trypsin-like peptidase domain-containing protein [Paenarthrobacter sp. TYUT067]MCM0614695.1 trypsin-like peptidase domain-containing protein [Paenarthrobacter sp. TYUT067]